MDINLSTLKNPKSYISESIKTIRTNLLFSSIDKKLKTVLVTSTNPGEGKSFISSNLAVAFAQSDCKVLIMDCDMRRGRQHEIFNVSNRTGLSNLLIGGDNVEIENFIQKTSVKNVELITAGIVPPNPLELLSSDRFLKNLEYLKEKYDLIIIDSSPISRVSDSLVLSKRVDETVIVAAANKTTNEDLEQTVKSLKNVGAQIAGIVLNQKKVPKKDYYGKYYHY
ncbi:MAG: CpsD/CapB family tyrosine-protein kinase [Bacilli bacterium]|nr:CpsD/CapB family tyrosine-protein kinase [Bacilli bacterium]